MRPQHMRQCTALEHNLPVLTYTIGTWDLPHSFNKARCLLYFPFVKGYEHMPYPFEIEGSIKPATLLQLM